MTIKGRYRHPEYKQLTPLHYSFIVDELYNDFSLLRTHALLASIKSRKTIDEPLHVGTTDDAVTSATSRVTTTSSSITLPADGLIISFIGCDGSGKSTITSELTSFLSSKLDIYNMYLGSGDGTSSLIRYPLKLLKQWTDKRHIKKGNPLKQEHLHGRKLRTKLTVLAKFTWALTLSFEKRKKLKKIRKLRSLGYVIITDRYPQYQIMGRNDGPLLHDWIQHKNKIIQYLARWESRIYKEADMKPPDLIVRLNISADIAFQRKKDMKFEEFRKRVKDISSLEFNEKATVIEIDANRSLNEVLSEVKTKIWGHI
ncbi:hypothetical protein [Bacillus sp. SM2101]|uniref:hypothetical protein n=1 Tax=Bacillus sp. SM2101 TaxID=2805366 RepID=UPI001BDEED3B|nr:hypothetical protein [Bacillus sp. SM2101]